MKLRNKKTGEIAEWDFGNWYQHILNPDNKEAYECTLSEFMDRTVEFREEWEDYEGQKEYWCINEFGTLGQITHARENMWDKSRKEFGNCFESREEAEKAVEKLKAWKRLKDNGFRFIEWELDMKTFADGKIWFDVETNTQLDAEFLLECEPEIRKSLDLLFGGEE